MTNKPKNYSFFSNKGIIVLIFLAFVLFVLMHLFPKIGEDVYLVIEWALLIGVPIALIYEFLAAKKT